MIFTLFRLTTQRLPINLYIRNVNQLTNGLTIYGQRPQYCRRRNGFVYLQSQGSWYGGECIGRTGVSALSVTAISFTPTTASTASKMSLADGSIGAASAIGSLTPMSLSATKGTYIMLPVGSVAVNVEITVNATIGGTTVTAKKYTAAIPSQAYTSGSYYTTNFTVSSTALQFTGAQVQDWTNQTISGVSLTEQ